MSKVWSIQWDYDELGNIWIEIYQERQTKEKYEDRTDYREIYLIKESSVRGLSKIKKFFYQFDVIEINGGERVEIPSTNKAKLDEWEKLRDDLLEEGDLFKV